MENDLLRKIIDRLSRVETKVEGIMDNHLPEIQKDIKWIIVKLSTYRPPWSIVVIISFLCSLSVGLIVYGIFGR